MTITVRVSDSTEAELLEPADGELTWLSTDWNTAKTVKVRGVSDDIADGDQSYSVILGADNNSRDRRFRYVDPPDVTLKNLDLTNKGTFYISGVSGTTDENGEEATFTVRLSSRPSDNDSSTADNVTITVSVSDPSEAVLVSAKKLVFDQDNWNSPQTVTVRGVYDNVSDGDQPFTVVLKDNVTSDNRFLYVDPPDVSMTNLDLTDKGSFYISGVTGTTDENENNEAWFTVRLSSQPQDNDTTNDPDLSLIHI